MTIVYSVVIIMNSPLQECRTPAERGGIVTPAMNIVIEKPAAP